MICASHASATTLLAAAFERNVGALLRIDDSSLLIDSCAFGEHAGSLCYVAVSATQSTRLLSSNISGSTPAAAAALFIVGSSVEGDAALLQRSRIQWRDVDIAAAPSVDSLLAALNHSPWECPGGGEAYDDEAGYGGLLQL